MNILNEINQLYEKQTKDLFEEERYNENFNIQKKAYDKYYNKSVACLDEIDMSKLSGGCEKLEADIKERIGEYEEVEESMKNILYSNLIDIEYEQKNLENFIAFNKTLKGRTEMLGNKIKKLENESVDSIKKMKTSYEKEDVGELRQCHLGLEIKRKEFREQNLLKENSLKILDEKTQTWNENLAKVARCENELEATKEKYNQAAQSQHIILEETENLEKTKTQFENECKDLDTHIILRKNKVYIYIT